MDQSHAVRFVISHSLFDGESKRWRLNPTTIVDTLGNLAPLIGREVDFARR